jgi:hypothetical protein
MRDGIMYMEKVKIIIPDHVYHGARKRSFIRRVIKKRVSRDLHLMIEYIGNEFAKPDGLLVGDKVDLVPFLGKGLS